MYDGLYSYTYPFVARSLLFAFWCGEVLPGSNSSHTVCLDTSLDPRSLSLTLASRHGWSGVFRPGNHFCVSAELQPSHIRSTHATKLGEPDLHRRQPGASHCTRIHEVGAFFPFSFSHSLMAIMVSLACCPVHQSMWNNVVNAWWPLVFYPATDAPRFSKGMITMLCTCATTLLVTFVVWYLERREHQLGDIVDNKSEDRQAME